MKKKFLKATLLTVLCVFSSMAEAQLEKGMKRLGGNLVFGSSSSANKDSLSSTNMSSTSFSVSPSIGYFLGDKVCLGLEIPVGFGQNNSSYSNLNYYPLYPNSKEVSFSYGVMPYLRYYMNFTDKLYGYFNLKAGFGIQNSEETISGYAASKIRKNSYYNYSSGLDFGLIYFVSPKLAIETSIVGLNYNGRYATTKEVSYENYNKSHNLYFSYAPSSLILGVSYYFK